MREDKQFTNGELFGITAYDRTVRTGYKAATVGTFDFQIGKFRVNFISTEGVVGSSQRLRFETREQAQEWINNNAESYGYEVADLRVSDFRTTETDTRIPVDGCDFDGWVSNRKWRYISPNTLNRLERDCPEYFGIETEQNHDGLINGRHTLDSYRGWKLKVSGPKCYLFRLYSEVKRDCRNQNIEVEILHNDTAVLFDRINERNLPRDQGELYLGLGSEENKDAFMAEFAPSYLVGQNHSRDTRYHSTTRYILLNQHCWEYWGRDENNQPRYDYDDTYEVTLTLIAPSTTRAFFN